MEIISSPEELLTMFSADNTTLGAAAFRAIVYKCLNGVPLYLATAQTAHEMGLSLRVMNAHLRRSVEPILSADGQTLSALGLNLRRRTGPMLAAAVADALRARV